MRAPRRPHGFTLIELLVGTAIGALVLTGIGLVFVLGIGVLLLGVVIMIIQAIRHPAFFRGETLGMDAPPSARRR